MILFRPLSMKLDRRYKHSKLPQHCDEPFASALSTSLFACFALSPLLLLHASKPIQPPMANERIRSVRFLETLVVLFLYRRSPQPMDIRSKTVLCELKKKNVAIAIWDQLVAVVHEKRPDRSNLSNSQHRLFSPWFLRKFVVFCPILLSYLFCSIENNRKKPSFACKFREI